MPATLHNLFLESTLELWKRRRCTMTKGIEAPLLSVKGWKNAGADTGAGKLTSSLGSLTTDLEHAHSKGAAPTTLTCPRTPATARGQPMPRTPDSMTEAIYCQRRQMLCCANLLPPGHFTEPPALRFLPVSSHYDSKPDFIQPT